MKRLLTISLFSLALFVGVTSDASSAHAEDCTEGYTQTNSGNFYNTSGNPCTVGADSPEVTESADSNITLEESPASDPSAEKTVIDKTGKPTTGDLMSQVMVQIMRLFAWLLGVAAIALNYAVYHTVVVMGTYVHGLAAVGVTWQIMRDVGNIMLIFGFLAAGIMTILNVSAYGFGKKMLPMLLVGAIFINFSLFFAEAVIDTGNLFATQFYSQINGGGPITPPSVLMTSVANEGISNKIMSQLGLASIYSAARNGEVLKDGTNQLLIGFMSIILFIVAAFVMLSLAFILIARFVYLIFLIILAPVGFAGLAIPKLDKMTSWWWNTLFEQTITAPVLLLLLYIALAVITDARFLTGLGVNGGSMAAVGFLGNADLPGFAGFILSFLVAMGLLLFVVISSKKLSAVGAAGASKLAGGLTFGATALAARSTVGAGSHYFAHQIRARFGGTKTGRIFASALDAGAHASFDVRGATAFGGLKAIGVDAGSAQKGGYHATREANIKGHEEYVKSVHKVIDSHAHITEEDEYTLKAKNNAAVQDRNLADQKQALAKTKVNNQQKEVERLAKANEENKKRNKFDPNYDADAEKKLTDAQEKLAQNKEELAAAVKSLNKAAKAVEDVSKKTAEDMMKDRVKEEKIQVAKQYAENIKGSFPGWVIYGSGGGEAAAKIIKDSKKNEQQKLLETLQKSLNPAPAAHAEETHAAVAPAHTPDNHSTPAATAGHANH